MIHEALYPVALAIAATMVLVGIILGMWWTFEKLARFFRK